jgi:peptidoglycan/LPS O-acetylase OafA/YrhL
MTHAHSVAAGGTRPLPLPHRPEIDGLRAFAILPILLLHCGVSQLRGGFVGVDVFFVISGYLITAIVMREMDAGTFSLTAFYRRRIVRILPALLTMVVIVLALGCLLLFPVPLRDLANSAAATAAFGSNIYFYATSDYFSQASDMKPLVHTWSLAVEEQFYLLYPLLLLALRKLERRALVAVLMAIGAASLAAGVAFAFHDLTAGFYLLPARAWELVLGGLVALGAHPRIASPRLRGALCWLALGTIVASVVVTRPTWPFPVPFALPPAGATAILLAYAPQTRAATLLSWAPLRGIGLISYALYLWHRPIIAFTLAGRSWVTTPLDTAILLALSFVAAILSYALVERPALRRWRSGGGIAPHMAAAAALLALIAASLTIAVQAERIRSLPPEIARVVGYLGFDRTPRGVAQYRTGTCFALPYEKPHDPACLQPALDRPNVLLVGDSHAAQLSQALRQAIAPAHLVQATAAGCRPMLVTNGLASCRKLTLAVLRDMDLSHITGVVLAGRWFDIDVMPMEQTVQALRARGIRVVVVGPMVEYNGDMPDLLARAMQDRDLARMARLRTADRPVLDRAMHAAITRAGGTYLSYFPLECPGGHCQLFTPSGAPMHIDYSHLSPEGAEPMARQIARELSPR